MTTGAGAGAATLARRTTVAQDLVEAARSLMWETGAPVFTVSQVVAAAGTSLKSFYRCFGSKDELLVALFADDAKRGADALAAVVAADEDPVLRVRAAVEGLFGFLAVDGPLPYAAALVREHLRLSETRPRELQAVLQPFVDVFRTELAAAGHRGLLAVGDPAVTARTLLHLVVSHLHALLFHQIDEPPARVAGDVWAFCAAALRP
ncbi:MAG: TetR/AcrR family transcriptional regulator [Acidimicrobiales bacterium]